MPLPEFEIIHTVERAREVHDEINGCYLKILSLGEFFTRMKADIKLTGEKWLDWVQTDLRIHHAQVSNYMRIYRHRDAISTVGRSLSVKACLRICKQIEGKTSDEKEAKVVSFETIQRTLAKWHQELGDKAFREMISRAMQAIIESPPPSDADGDDGVGLSTGDILPAERGSASAAF